MALEHGRQSWIPVLPPDVLKLYSFEPFGPARMIPVEPARL
jgi:hypothetical protein